MDLIYTDLDTEASQEITMINDCNLVYIRPHVIKHGSPGGSIKVQVLDENDYLIGESSSVTVASISTFDYAHGYVRLPIDVPLKAGSTYKINLVGHSGYTFSDANHVGFCRDFDLRKVRAAYTSNLGADSAYDIELWERKVSDRTVEFFDGFETASSPTAQNSTEFAIGDNTASPTSVTGLVLDSTDYQDGYIEYSLWRGDDTEERKGQGVLRITYHPDAATWSLFNETTFDSDVGVTFTVNSSGQVLYVSDSMGGANYEGYMRYEIMKKFEPKA